MQVSAAPRNPFAEHAPIAPPRVIEAENPYQTPAATVALARTPQLGHWYGAEDPRIASRWKRFQGAVIDLMAYGSIVFITTVATYRGDAYSQIFAAVGGGCFLALFALQVYLISSRGQSLGKIAARTRILHVESDETVGFLHGVLLRNFIPNFFLGIFFGISPFVGWLFCVADAMFILGGERRCLHDRIASTKVIDLALIEAEIIKHELEVLHNRN
ncbi:MAG TPA: RDD family protein [Pirellulaceae bacterium]|nr:RDD family protein [Pirellulaceae bacterium]